MNKATIDELNGLHGLVAQQLSELVKEGDLKAIEKAIAFLKNNNISADLVESRETKDLFTSIEELTKDKRIRTSDVDEIISMYQ